MDENNAYNEKSLTEYVFILWRKKWSILIPTLIMTAIVAIVSFTMTPVWEVDAVLLPSKFVVQTGQGQIEEFLVTDPKQLAGQIKESSYNNAISAELKIDLRTFPRIEAENIKDTKLIRVSVKEKDISKGKRILASLFQNIKSELDKKAEVEVKSYDTQISAKQNDIKDKEFSIKDNENQIDLKRLGIKDQESDIRTRENEIKKKKNDMTLKDLEVEARKIDKDKAAKDIETEKNRIKISEERYNSIFDEMKAAKVRIDELDKTLQKALAEKKQAADSIGLLLYSNEIQQNLRYYNSLEERLSAEKLTQQNSWSNIREKEADIRQADNQIEQVRTQKESLTADIANIETSIGKIKTEIDKIHTEIRLIRNDNEKIKNTINTLGSDIQLLINKKARVDYAQFVKSPTPSINPVAPNKRMNVILSFIIGFAFFSLIVLTVENIKKLPPSRPR